MKRSGEKRSCQTCGIELKNYYQSKYCSRACYWAGRYGEETEWFGLTVRTGKAVAALQLLREGMPPNEVSSVLDISYDAVGRVLRKHGVEELLPERACAWCEKSLAKFSRHRKYCSKDCFYDASYARKHAGKVRVPVQIDIGARKAGLALYWGGLDSGSIARYLDVPKKTVKSWIQRYGGERMRKICPKALELGALRHWLREAKTAEQWGEILEASAQNAGETKHGELYLVCACVNGRAEWSYYASIVMDRLKMNPLSGETYAFCNVLRTTVTAITWRNDTFLLTRAGKASGTYLWPPEDLGGVLTISDGAFRHLLAYQKYTSKMHEVIENT